MECGALSKFCQDKNRDAVLCIKQYYNDGTKFKVRRACAAVCNFTASNDDKDVEGNSHCCLYYHENTISAEIGHESPIHENLKIILLESRGKSKEGDFRGNVASRSFRVQNLSKKSMRSQNQYQYRLPSSQLKQCTYLS